MESGSVASVLSEIAATAAETLELDQVFDRLAASVRKLIPCDHMSVVRIVAGERAVVHATTDPRRFPGARARELPLAAWSPRWRPQPGAPNEGRGRRARAGRQLPTRSGGARAGSGIRALGALPPRKRVRRRSLAVLEGEARVQRRAPAGAAARSPRCSARRSSTGGSGTPSAAAASGSTRLETLLATLAESLDVRRGLPAPLGRDRRPLLPHDLLDLTELDLRPARSASWPTPARATSPVARRPVALTKQEVENRADGVRDPRATSPPSWRRPPSATA